MNKKYRSEISRKIELREKFHKSFYPRKTEPDKKSKCFTTLEGRKRIRPRGNIIDEVMENNIVFRSYGIFFGYESISLSKRNRDLLNNRKIAAFSNRRRKSREETPKPKLSNLKKSYVSLLDIFAIYGLSDSDLLEIDSFLYDLDKLINTSFSNSELDKRVGVLFDEFYQTLFINRLSGGGINDVILTQLMLYLVRRKGISSLTYKGKYADEVISRCSEMVFRLR